VYQAYPAIYQWCADNPEQVLYGEVFGSVQDLKYNAQRGELFFAAFAIWDAVQNVWWNYAKMEHSLDLYGVLHAPVLYRGPLYDTIAYRLAETDSRWANGKHLAEGVVIVPEVERVEPRFGRVCAKIVSNRYLERRRC
jgi:hypothetical protein